MTAIFAFADRCRREIMRDPLSLIFGIALPLVLLVLMSLLNRALPDDIFPIARFAPGMAVFSLSFLMLFGGLLLASDRSSAFLDRCFASPMRPGGYLLAYGLPLLPIGLMQGAICLTGGLCFGLDLSPRLLLTVLALIPGILLYVALGLLLGSLCSDKQVGAASSVIVQAASLLSGIWFDLSLIGGTFGTVARCLPFWHAVQCAIHALAGEGAEVLPHAAVTLGWSALLFAAAAFCFSTKMRRGR